VKGKQEKYKIGTKPDKNGKRGEAGKSQKQLQSRKKEKTKENAERRAKSAKSYKLYKRKKKERAKFASRPNLTPIFLLFFHCNTTQNPRGCALLREKLEEDLVTYFQNFQNISESSDDSTNVVNAPREPFIVKQDHGVNPLHIDECCCKCGNALNGIFCQQCTCKSCRKGPHETFQCQPPQYTVNHLIFDTHNDLLSSRTKLMEQMTTLTSMCEMVCHIFQKKQEEKWIEEEQAANARYWKIPTCCDDDDDYNFAITPVLSTEEPVDSLSIPDTMCDVHLVNNPTPLEAKDHFEIVINSNDDISSSDDDSLYNENIEYVEASPHDSEVVSLDVAEIVIPEVKEIEDDNLREKLLNVHLLIANIEISSSSTTIHSYVSVSEYDSFTFDLSNDQYPPTDRSDFTHEEFADELAHIISPPEYDCFYFRNLPDPGELMSILNSGIRENFPSTTRVNLPIEDDHSPLLAYVVWIFLAYLTYPVIPPYLHSFGNKDTIFDPGITINHFYLFKPGLSHRCGAFNKFNTYRSHLNKWPMIINGKNIQNID
nr:hypothetical protein [Tanacetum cinerariifolium]